MLDPILPPAPWLSAAVKPLADKVGLYALPDHVHELVFAFLLYQSIQTFVSPVLSAKLFPNVYPKLNWRSRINWDVHVVSLVQSTMINAIAIWVMFSDQERKDMTSLERIYGYTGACGLVGALGAGYFIWDLIVSTIHFKIFGVGILAHAAAALCVFGAGFRPYLQYYGSPFILYELSSPFLNIHWFLDKLHMTGSRLQWYNGILLLSTFAACRLVWGTYQSVLVYQDIWAAMNIPSNVTIAEAVSHTVSASVSQQILVSEGGQCTLGDPICAAAQTEIIKYINHAGHLSWPLAFSTLASNLILNSLNFFWFGKMIKTVKSRFDGTPDPNADKEEVVAEEVVLDAAEALERKAAEGKGEVTNGGFDTETKRNQTEDAVKGAASAVEEKANARSRKKA